VSAAQRALALNDSLADAYLVLASMATMDRKWAEARAHFLRAIASEPKNLNAHVWYGEYLVSVGHIRHALEETLIGYQLDPQHRNTNAVLAEIYSILDDADNMLKYSRVMRELGDPRGLRIQAWAHIRPGEFDRAIVLAEEYDISDSLIITLKQYTEMKIDAANRPLLLEKLAQHELALSSELSVLIYAGLGRIDDAFRMVNLGLGRDSADADRSWWFLWLPDLVTFRQDPRFVDLVTELGLLDYWHEYGWPDACQPAGDSLSCE